MNKIYKTYNQFLKKYGPQGWWPLIELHDKPNSSNPTKTGSINGYHPKNYSYPKTELQIFEICIGAILTQNTNWPNVEKALLNLKNQKLLNPKKIKNNNEEKIKEAIKPSGYFNQKTKKLICFSEFFSKLKSIPKRKQLLDIWGIGPETADSILLYAFNQLEFVIDAYTKRIFSQLEIINGNESYDELKNLFETNLNKEIKNKKELLITYQEYHALIVEHAKNIPKNNNKT